MNPTFSNANNNSLKAILGMPQTTVTADGVVEIEYDAELEKIVNVSSPTYAYLRQAGCETTTKSSKVGFRSKDRKTIASFIGEAEPLAEHDPSIFERHSETVTTIHYPMSFSDIIANDTEIVDVVQSEIEDGMDEISRVKDDAILQGDKSKNANQFDGFTTLFKTNVTDLKKAQITLEDLGALAQSLMDEGGHPSAIITSAAIGRRLQDLINAKTTYIYAPSQDLGFNTNFYVTPEGTRIPIIIDYNLKPSANGDQLIMIDENTINIKEYQAPYIKELATDRFAINMAIGNVLTMFCRSEKKNGFLYNINPKIE